MPPHTHTQTHNAKYALDPKAETEKNANIHFLTGISEPVLVVYLQWSAVLFTAWEFQSVMFVSHHMFFVPMSTAVGLPPAYVHVVINFTHTASQIQSLLFWRLLCRSYLYLWPLTADYVYSQWVSSWFISLSSMYTRLCSWAEPLPLSVSVPYSSTHTHTHSYILTPATIAKSIPFRSIGKINP